MALRNRCLRVLRMETERASAVLHRLCASRLLKFRAKLGGLLAIPGGQCGHVLGDYWAEHMLVKTVGRPQPLRLEDIELIEQVLRAEKVGALS